MTANAGVFTAMPTVVRTCTVAALFLSLWVLAVPARAQTGDDHETTEELRENPYGSGIGLEILLTNNGFGLGGYYHRALGESTSLMAEVSLGAGKDEQELKFFRFGSSYIPNKANYLLMMPAQVGISHRLFREEIEDNFRPFVQVTGGPTLGWEYPYFSDSNGNGRYDNGEDTYDSIGALPRGEMRLGFGGTIALGAHFGISKKVTQGVRIGYTFTYFLEGIQLLEPDVQEAQQYFGTPTISLIFGKLL